MTMNRRRWLARAAACASAGTAFEFRLTGQPPAAPQLPARSDFPIAETATFLNNAAWHPLSSGALGAMQTYLQRKSTGSTRFSYAPAGNQVKALIAKLIHAPASSISFVPSTTVGENLVVAGLGFPRTQGNIVTDALHYESSTYLYRSLQAQGLDVRFVKPREGRSNWQTWKRRSIEAPSWSRSLWFLT
jgi:selenocysteine lyase/cysteine desulfurase